MLRESLNRARRSVAPAGDPYAHVDLSMATKMGGAIYLVGIAYATLVLPLSNPSGPFGIAGTAACIVAAAIVGVRLLRTERPAHPNALLTLCYLGVAVSAVYRASAGAGSPFGQLLFLAVMYTCAVHPARRAAGVAASAVAAALSPLLYEGAGANFAALTISNLALTLSFGFIVLIWMTRVRGARRETEEAREQADRLARIDALTGLGNRRALEEALPVAVAAARRVEQPLSVLVADLDGFKAINDGFGHGAGDDALRAVARGLTTAVRMPDPCFRWAGDEFVALLPGATLDEARMIAKRVSETVALSVRRPDGRPVRISVGAAELTGSDAAQDMFDRADADLLAAKAARAARAAAAV
jgi:diguanylate cyclase (GGDEF)-like protein